MQQIQITAPLSAAMERTKELLFRPFDLGKWCLIGFSAWLASLGEGASGGFNVNMGRGLEGKELGDVQGWIAAHLAMIIAVVALLFLVVIALSLVFAWIRGRGTFMYIDGLVHGKTEIAESWRRWKVQGNSCFVFTIIFGLATFCAFLLLLGAGIIGVAVAGGIHSPGAIVVAVTLFLAIGLPFLAAISCTWLFFNDFVVLIMYRLKLPAGEAWRIFSRLFQGHKGDFILYGLFRLVLGMAIGAIVLAAGLLTCCCGFILLALPYVGSVVLLPISATLRYYSIEFLKQFGPDFDADLV